MSKFKHGCWFNDQTKWTYVEADDEKAELFNFIRLDHPELPSEFSGSMKVGDFGPASPEVAKISGSETNNWKLDIPFMPAVGVMNEEGTKAHCIGLSGKLETWEWKTPEEIEKLKEDREHYKEPSCDHYKVRNLHGF